MSNSPLVSYTKISPNRTNGRHHAIDTITIHCVVGQCSVETLGEIFAPYSQKASSNYGIGYDGRIGMYAEEKDRSWCSSNSANDNRAVTIEVASDMEEPYAVKPVVYDALIKLVADICVRNGINKLVWSTDKFNRVNHVNGCNMTVHRDYEPGKSCPGTYLYEHMGDIASKVNALISAVNQEENDMTRAEILDIFAEAMTKEMVYTAMGDKYITDFSSLPEWAKPEVKELIEAGAVNGVSESASPEETVLNMPLSTVRAIIIAARYIKAQGGKGDCSGGCDVLERLRKALT